MFVSYRGNRGNIFTLLVTSAGTFTTLPVILNFFPLDNYLKCPSLGAINLHSSSFRWKNSGFSGNFIPFEMAHGGHLPFFQISIARLAKPFNIINTYNVLEMFNYAWIQQSIFFCWTNTMFINNCSQHEHRVSHRRSEGCGFDSRLGLRDIFLSLR